MGSSISCQPAAGRHPPSDVGDRRRMRRLPTRNVCNAASWAPEPSEGAVIADKVGDTACTFLAGLYRAEQAIAERLIRILSGRLPWPWIDEEKALPWVE